MFVEMFFILNVVFRCLLFVSMFLRGSLFRSLIDWLRFSPSCMFSKASKDMVLILTVVGVGKAVVYGCSF